MLCMSPKDALMGNPQYIIWNPVKRSDISWNFEKFLISADGNPIKRFSGKFPAKDVVEGIFNLG